MKTKIFCLCCLCGLLASCISTESVPDGDQLFTGLKKISYDTDTLPARPSPLAPRTHRGRIQEYARIRKKHNAKNGWKCARRDSGARLIE